MTKKAKKRPKNVKNESKLIKNDHKVNILFIEKCGF